MAATVWTGYLTFGLISMPVRLYSGARGERVSMHMLHRDDLTRIKTQLYCPNDERVVDRGEIVKGYEYRKGEYVVVDPEEIKKIQPKTAKAMEILEFVKAEDVDPIYFESSYYLTPEEPGRRPYALLVRALEDSGYLAVARLTMHNREYTCLLRPYNGGLLLHTMYYQNEIRKVEQFGQQDIQIRAGELKVAEQLVQALAAKWDPGKYHDTFEDNLKGLIRAHLEGKEVPAVAKAKPPAPAADLMDALKQSLAQMKTQPPKKPPQRATRARSTSAAEGKHASRKKSAA
jgi:DNA end-binding protein Ku